MADRLKPSLGGRFEESPTGRAVISVGLVFALLAFLSSNLPASEIQRRLNRVVHPVRDAIGLDQNWSVFAPDPRSETWRIRADISLSDGSSVRWVIPDGDAFIGEYRFYRWKKYAEGVYQRNRSAAWPHLALWLVRQTDRPDRHPVRVELTRMWSPFNPPGSRVTQRPQEEQVFYVLPVTPQVLREATKR